MEIVFSNYTDSIGVGAFNDIRDLLITRVSQEIEASLISCKHPSSPQARSAKYGGKIRELVNGLGESFCSCIFSVIFEDQEVADSLQVRFKGRKDIRLNIYFDDPEQLIFDHEGGLGSVMTVDNEDEAYLSYISAKERYIEFGTLQAMIKELKKILTHGVSEPNITEISL